MPRAAGVPVIDGQTEGYLYVELRDYARGVRGDAAMQPIAAALSRDEMAALATYFAALPWPSRRLRLDDAERQAARLLARGGQCTQCHLAGYLGAGTAPRLAGQSAAYLRATMLAFRSGARANNAAMSALLGRQSDAAIATLAAYLAAFQP